MLAVLGGLIIICISMIVWAVVDGYCLPAVIFSFFTSLCISILIEEVKEPQTQAIDVYRNNTELKITYEICNGDTLSCDSTVVFKQKTL